MIRTQVYLTKEERRELRAIAERTGATQSQLIREAVDAYVAKAGERQRSVILERTFGIWKQRPDLPDFRALRRSWDRGEAS